MHISGCRAVQPSVYRLRCPHRLDRRSFATNSQHYSAACSAFHVKCYVCLARCSQNFTCLPLSHSPHCITQLNRGLTIIHGSHVHWWCILSLGSQLHPTSNQPQKWHSYNPACYCFEKLAKQQLSSVQLLLDTQQCYCTSSFYLRLWLNQVALDHLSIASVNVKDRQSQGHPTELHL